MKHAVLGMPGLKWMGVLMWLLFSQFSAAQTLSRYTCITKQWDTDNWMYQYDRLFDAEGIVVQKGEYHPLAIAFWGIMNYEDYLSTGDTAPYRQVINQYKFFSNDANLIFYDKGRGAALPYHTQYRDLKPPWFSGMTQGVAISFMLRYYTLVQDSQALDLAKKFAHYMLLPIDSGGTIGKTPEGFTWIEEYPRSVQQTQVLNGFINGLIGLYEYLQFFPEDTLARRIHDQAYEALLISLPLYDTDDWTNYNRRETRVTNQYMRYELAQMEHLYELYHEPMFLRQMKIWAFFAYRKMDRAIHYYRNPSYQFGVKLAENGEVNPVHDTLFPKGFRQLQGGSVGEKEEVLRLPLRWKGKRPLVVKLSVPANLLRLQLDQSVPGFQVSAVAENGEHQPVSVEVYVDSNAVYIGSCENFSRITVQPFRPRMKKLHILDIASFDTDNGQVPMFLFDTITLPFPLEKGKSYRIHYRNHNVCDLTLFYKSAEQNGPALRSAHWYANRFVEDPGQPFKAPKSGYYTFLCSFRFVLPKAGLSGFRLEEVE